MPSVDDDVGGSATEVSQTPADKQPIACDNHPIVYWLQCCGGLSDTALIKGEI